MKTALQSHSRGWNYIGAVKQSHSGFPKKFLYDVLTDLPGGSRLVMEGVHSHTGEKLIATGYKYASGKKVQFYVSTVNAGTTRPGEPYHMRFNDE